MCLYLWLRFVNVIKARDTRTNNALSVDTVVVLTADIDYRQCWLAVCYRLKTVFELVKFIV